MAETELLDPPATDIVESPEPTLRDSIETAIEAEGGDSEGEGKPGEPKPESAEPAPTAVAPTAPVAEVVAPASTELKAPAQWKPAVREKWAALPREVQEEVLRREGDNLRLIGSVGTKIRMADEIGGHLAPFMDRLQAHGASPSEFMGDVFGTIKSLATGSVQERAEVIANIIQSYGVDLRTLDSVLTGRLSAPPPDPRLVEAQRRTAMAEGQLRQVDAQRQQHTQQTVTNTLSEFASDQKNEFFDDVRELMADLVESGRANTLQDAYSSAIWANPDTRKILLQREAESRAIAKNTRATHARRASLSVGGAPRGAGATTAGQNMSLRDTIAAAFDEQSPA